MPRKVFPPITNLFKCCYCFVGCFVVVVDLFLTGQLVGCFHVLIWETDLFTKMTNAKIELVQVRTHSWVTKIPHFYWLPADYYLNKTQAQRSGGKTQAEAAIHTGVLQMGKEGGKKKRAWKEMMSPEIHIVPDPILSWSKASDSVFNITL